MDLDLRDQVVVVTGAASGIGRATARSFAAEGARVALWDLGDAAAAVAAEIESDFATEAIGYAADVTQETAVASALRATAAALGPVDHVVHAAAIGSGRFGFPFMNLDPLDWRRVLDVNIMGMVNVAHALAPHMIPHSRGTFCFLASVAGQIGSPTDPPYSASKAANINFAQVMAKDLAKHGIRVNTVCPGMVQTPLNRSVWQAWYDQTDPEARLSYDDWAMEKIRAVTPLGKWQPPEAIADMIVFLASNRAAHVTGQTINVDGGFVMHW